MTAPSLADCYVPVPLRWRLVQPGDVIVGRGGRLWTVHGISAGGCEDSVTLISGPDRYETRGAPVDPDEVATVLMLATERDALATVRDILGGQLTERRSAA